MNAPPLSAVVVDTAPAPHASVIWMHGLGDTGHGWSQVVPELGLPPTLAVRFVFPHAPSMPVTLNQGYVMPAWYDVRAADFQSRADLAGVRASRERIEALVAAERARGVPASRIVLAGFSQGGVIALYTGLRHAERLAGIVALSTYLPCGELILRERTAANSEIAIIAAHGRADDVVSPELGRRARDFLVSHGYRVDWHEYPMAHAVCLEEIRLLGGWLRERLR